MRSPKVFRVACPGLTAPAQGCGVALEVTVEDDFILDVVGCPRHSGAPAFNEREMLAELERASRKQAEEHEAARYYHESGGL